MKKHVIGRIVQSEQRFRRKIGKKIEEAENIYNVPNTLTLLRVLITFITIYFIFAGYDVKVIAGLFIFGMLTDFFDGQIARRFNMKTEFGRKFDMIADRFLMIGVALAFVINLALFGVLKQEHILEILMIMSRELIAAPVAFISMSSGKNIPYAKKIGKFTTFMQAVTFPIIILSIYYPAFEFSLYLALFTGVVGVFSGFTYIFDVLNSEVKSERAGRR
ncbi:MAG: CDP-alcohol phosphatidyltransferase family protein [Nanoarchaeota archaeon]